MVFSKLLFQFSNLFDPHSGVAGAVQRRHGDGAVPALPAGYWLTGAASGLQEQLPCLMVR